MARSVIYGSGMREGGQEGRSGMGGGGQEKKLFFEKRQEEWRSGGVNSVGLTGTK